MQRLIVFEFHLLGDAIMGLPFLNGVQKNYDLYVCCSPAAAKIYQYAVPADRLIILQRPPLKIIGFRWPDWVDYLKTLGHLWGLKADIGVTVWADVRVHFLMMVLAIPQRIGFSMNRVNYYAHELPVRRKKLEQGELIQRALAALHLKPLTTALQRGDYRQHHVEDWRQLAGALEIPWNVQSPWLDVLGMEVPEFTKSFFANHAGHKIWFLHPGAGKEVRRWPHYNFIVRELFAPRNIPLIILDDPDVPKIDVHYEHCLHVPIGSLTDFFAMVARCHFILCNDSAATHVGTALRKQVISIFGPGSSDWFAPYVPDGVVIESCACPYRPCLDNCVQPTLVCLDDITPGRVAVRIEELLNEAKRPGD